MATFKILVDIASLIGNTLASIASILAIYLYWKKKPEISAAIKLLLNWSFQTTLTDLHGKIDRCSVYNASEPLDLPEIRNIFHEISGQIKGNKQIVIAAPDLAGRVEKLASSTKLTEPRKRSMATEVREVLKNIQVNSLGDPFKDKT